MAKKICIFCGESFGEMSNQCPYCGYYYGASKETVEAVKENTVEKVIEEAIEEPIEESVEEPIEESVVSSTIQQIRDFENGIDANRENVISENKNPKNANPPSVEKRKTENKKTGAFLYFVQRFVITVEIIALIGLSIQSIYFITTHQKYEKVTKQSASEVVSSELAVNEEFQKGDYAISVGEPYIIENLEWGFGDGYEVVCVPVEARYTTPKDPYKNYEISSMITAFAMTTDGKYIEPISEYEVEKRLGISQMGVFGDVKIRDSFMGKGIMCFAVKTGTWDSMMLNEYAGKYTDYKYRQLEHVYYINDMEVTRVEK